MNYLTPEQILFIHARMIDETGGTHGIRDLSMLLSAVGRPQATFDGEDLYPSLFAKASALLDSLIRNHPFLDGNKRTGIAATAIFLQRNGWRLTASNQELETFTLEVAVSLTSLENMEAWLRNHSSE
jgi:death-on-curing protein